MSNEKKVVEIRPAAISLNEDAIKGIYVDGFGFHISNDIVILEAIISKPRVDIPTIVARIIFPRRVLGTIITKLSEGLELQKAKEEKEAQEKTKQGK